jgi:hypothetical protein
LEKKLNRNLIQRLKNEALDRNSVTERTRIVFKYQEIPDTLKVNKSLNSLFLG